VSNTVYQELSVLLDQQLTKSARFVRMAFHVHSPGSYDWANRTYADKTLNDQQSLETDAGLERYLDSLASEFEMVCVTDHMKTGYACRVAQAAEARDGITVFPGIEISVAGGQLGDSCIHVLAVFPPDCTTTTIDRIFGSPKGGGPFKSEAARDGRDVYEPGTLHELAASIHAQGGMFLLAHVDEVKRGQRARFRASREETLGCEWLHNQSTAPPEIKEQVSAEYLAYVAELMPDAIEIMNPGDQEHYVSIPTKDGKRRLPCVIRSDHHCLEDLKRDEWTTWVKVSRSDFRCVRDALEFFETRVRFKDDLPETPCPRIVGLRLQSPQKEGLFEDALVSFNPNLTCLIGPRGSGKSTLIEALRYVLCRTEELEQTSATVGGPIRFSDVALGIQRGNLEGTIIELIYEIEDGSRYCLRATYDAQSAATTTVYTLGGAARPMTPEAIQSEFPVRLYSWSEIENLGREPELQRTLLDRLVPDLPPQLEGRSKYVEMLREGRAEIDKACRQLEALVADDDGLLRRYVEFKAEFDQVNTEEVAALFAELDLAREHVTTLESVRDEIDGLRETIASASDLSAESLTSAVLDHGNEIRAWWSSTVAPVLTLGEFAESINKLTSAVLKQVDAKIAQIDRLLVSERQGVTTLEGDLRPRTQTDPGDEVVRDRREERRQRYERANGRRQEYLAAYARLGSLLEDRKITVEELEATQDQISDLRSQSRESLLEKLSPEQTGLDISIDLDVLADRGAPISYMRDRNFLTMQPFGHYKESKLAERTCRMARPTQIARAILDRDPALLEQGTIKLGDNDGLAADDGAKIIEHFNPFTEDEYADVQVVARAALLSVLELEEQPVDDKMRILLEGEPVDRRSPGQRSSAMLPLVALSETAPLVIDQPEDNLDNRMVGKTLTKILADLKERRQIIVTTHNPNIVVGGDAEQVIVLEPTGAHSAKVEDTGSIDDQVIIDHVVAVLEGGKEAFEVRNRRYRGSGPAA
jgi:ABC-type lipoprotein export system ATPase subunit